MLRGYWQNVLTRQSSFDISVQPSMQDRESRVSMPHPTPASSPGGAVFCRVEGILTTRTRAFALAWCIGNSQRLRHRIGRIAQFAAEDWLGARHRFSALRGMSKDRLTILGAQFCHRFIIPEVSAKHTQLLAQACLEQSRLVLISDHVDIIIAPLARLLGAAHVVCNRLEYQNGFATGRLREPIVKAAISLAALETLAQEEHIDLSKSVAYGKSGPDRVLLAKVGKPCAVRPDWRLRQVALRRAWPVVDS
ncbi:MAG: haloacid dehalogenase-like hydrolase [Myxococcales bacterium]|nr:haloacid dehalogenase-like hydrolase [Myxococcales bacterium]